ncbi:MAG: indole-3-glycerol phosphate synthase TrpC [Chthoniobacterales bacterium]|nr:indole-3-glycerol phosphate synthase TrpC [Chthoniobacterales bacterium]
MKSANFLEEIVRRRRAKVAQDRLTNNLSELRCAAEQRRAQQRPHRLRGALEQGEGVNIIGEFKRASPSLGAIRVEADAAQTAALYDAAGVSAISVLTEPEFFCGSLGDLCAVRAISALPLLRKDFIVDEFQIDEAAALGADAILLIVAALDQNELERLRRHAEETLGLDALVEIHSAEELERAAASGARLLGVNNRDLRTFVTSLETSEKLAALAPNDATLVSESGISTAAEIARLTNCGYRAFLIGEALMRAQDPAAMIRSLRGREREGISHV